MTAAPSMSGHPMELQHVPLVVVAVAAQPHRQTRATQPQHRHLHLFHLRWILQGATKLPRIMPVLGRQRRRSNISQNEILMFSSSRFSMLLRLRREPPRIVTWRIPARMMSRTRQGSQLIVFPCVLYVRSAQSCTFLDLSTLTLASFLVQHLKGDLLA